jgi:hypothetical protein
MALVTIAFMSRWRSRVEMRTKHINRTWSGVTCRIAIDGNLVVRESLRQGLFRGC